MLVIMLRDCNTMVGVAVQRWGIPAWLNTTTCNVRQQVVIDYWQVRGVKTVNRFGAGGRG